MSASRTARAKPESAAAVSTDDAVDQAGGDSPAPATTPARPPRAARTTSASAGKTKLGVYVDNDVLEALKNAYIALMDKLGTPSLSAFTTQLLTDQIDQLAREHNRGKAFPARNVEPRAGRPIS